MEQLFSFPNTERALREYGERVAAAYREKMRGHEHYTLSPDTLINRVDVIVQKGNASISVALKLADYWKYVEFGTRPHWPPKGAFIKWIEAKPILPHPDDNGRIPTPEQLDYLIRRAIAGQSPNQSSLRNPEGGTKGTHDLAEAVEEMNAQYLDYIAEALSLDLDAYTSAQITLLFGK